MGCAGLSFAFMFLCCKDTAVAAKSLQSCPTLCNPIDGSPPGSSVLGTLHTRILEWVAISFSSKEHNQSDFGVDHLVMSIVESLLVVLEEGVCYDQCIFLAKLY